MKKLIALSVCLCIALSFTNCKKKDKDPEPTPPTTTGSNPSTPSGDFYGWCRVYNEYQYYLWSQSEAAGTLPYARAYFTTTAINDASTTYTFQYAGQVIANTPLDTLQYTGGYYDKNIGAQAYAAPVNWKVAGGGSIPSFTTTCNVPFPTCTGYTTFPTNISKSAGVTFTITGFTNTDRIIVSLTDGNGQHTFQHYATISGNTATVNFPGSETANFINTTLGIINVFLYNDEVQNIGGKNIRFSNVKNNLITGFNIVN